MLLRCALLAGMVTLGACSTEGKVTPLIRSAGPAPTASTWALGVHGCEQVGQCEELRTSLVGRLIGAGMAERVVPYGQAAELSLDVKVDRVRAVSGTERILLGAIAGRNSVTSTDTLRDRQGNVLRSFRVESASAAHPFSGESGLSDAYRQYAADTVAALR